MRKDVPDSDRADFMTFNGAQALWIEHRQDQTVHLSNLDGSGRRLLSANQTAQFPQATGNLFLWDGYDEGPMVYDAGRDIVVRLVHQRAPVWAKGSWIVWQEHGPAPASTPTIKLLDTASLIRKRP